LSSRVGRISHWPRGFIFLKEALVGLHLITKEDDMKASASEKPFNWVGGKTHMLKELLCLIPEHVCYVEPFAGSAALFWAKDLSPSEVLNDYDEWIYNFYQVLKDPVLFQKLHEKASLLPYSRQIFEEMVEARPMIKDPVDKALALFYIANVGYAGKWAKPTFGYTVATVARGLSRQVRKWLTVLHGLPHFHIRIMHALIEKLDALDCIKRYDTDHTFFYLDPPYLGVEATVESSYEVGFTEEQHRDLLNLLVKIKGMAMISTYPNELYEKILRKASWTELRFGKHSFVARGKGMGSRAKGARIEVVWICPKTLAKLKAGKHHETYWEPVPEVKELLKRK